MKLVLILLLAVAVVTAESSYCEPGSTFTEDNCNWCSCSSDGETATCTAMACEDTTTTVQYDADQVTDIAQDYFDDLRCKEISVFKRDCNTCYCNEIGKVPECTMIGCIEDGDPDYTTTPLYDTDVDVDQTTNNFADNNFV